MKFGIYSPITPISSKISSHRSGWPRMLKAQIEHTGHEAEILIGDAPSEADLDRLDGILIYHGHEFDLESKSLNYFLKSPESYDKLASRLEDLYMILRSGKGYSVDGPMPLYGSLAKTRVREESTDRFKRIPFDDIDSYANKMNSDKKWWLQNRYGFKHLVVGDSHSTSVYRPGAAVSRNDFKTLNGALSHGLHNYFAPFSGIESGTFYFGNIDVRHHFTRHGEASVLELVQKYIEQIEGLGLQRVELITAMPIEPETRVLPKSGYYKGQPFWGSWEEREKLREHFNYNLLSEAQARDWSVFHWPKKYKDQDGKLLESVMEKPRSVHLSPEFYVWSR